MALNIENIRKVRDHIANLPPEKFDMGSWGSPECGTSACIGGWTIFVLGLKDEFGQPLNGQSLFARRNADNPVGAALGLTPKTATELFFPGRENPEVGLRAYQAGPSQAVAVLDGLINTRRVNWARALKAAA